ncbi:hypothetical protein SNE40_015564 [Patella caerulea]|uniref:Uncharacterized protein n=1 Tax=Patella caerulea TaxID=87958 RepID=A0AAN8JLE3_PATCE
MKQTIDAAACLHECLEGKERKKKWLELGSQAMVKLEKVLTNKRLENDIKKLSPMHQTSAVEAYHSVVNHFASKMIGFSY